MEVSQHAAQAAIGAAPACHMPATIEPRDLVAIIDTREQTPLDLAPLRVVRGTLQTGDYSVRGLEHHVAIERKSLNDLLGCVGRDRDRFDREIMRLLAYPVRCLVIESTWGEIERGDWRSDLKSSHVIGSLMGWVGQSIPVIMCGDHERAGRYVSRLLFVAARKRYRELRTLSACIGRSADGAKEEVTGS